MFKFPTVYEMPTTGGIVANGTFSEFFPNFNEQSLLAFIPTHPIVALIPIVGASGHESAIVRVVAFVVVLSIQLKPRLIAVRLCPFDELFDVLPRFAYRDSTSTIVVVFWIIRILTAVNHVAVRIKQRMVC